jgi:hypothetical protein
MKYFIGADIEAPHMSFYMEIDDKHFAGRWSWADKDGLPERGTMYYDDIETANETVEIFKRSGAGIGQAADTIQVVPLDI